MLQSIDSLAAQIRDLGGLRVDDIKELREEIVNSRDSIRMLQENLATEELLAMQAKLSAWDVRADSYRREGAILQQLSFGAMTDRREAIRDAHRRTFDWIFDHDNCFARWLAREEDPFWVSGVPGSGKSTLMKHLASHSQTRTLLQEWAGDKRLVIASFYFTITGSPMQKSQQGLLRSLLFEIFRQCPSFIPAVCPERWRAAPFSSAPWTRKELLETLRSLSIAHSSTSRLCLFIDGLDEYEDPTGSTWDGDETVEYVREIVEVVRMIASFPYVKLCISSRPWVQFEAAFGSSRERKIYLHDSNLNDIRVYVTDKLLRGSKQTLSGEAPDPSAELQDLVEEVTQASQGVFLWVFLVVNSLLRGLANHDRTAELKRRIATLPRDLDQYFRRMIDSVESLYQEQAAQILLVSVAALEPLYLASYELIGEPLQHQACGTQVKPVTEEQCKSRTKIAETRLAARCPDLLKVTKTALGDSFLSGPNIIPRRVDFLHRTVREYLLGEEIQKVLKSRLQEPFDANVYICSAMLSQIKTATFHLPWSSHTAPLLYKFIDDMTHYAVLSERASGESQTTLLDELHRVLAFQIQDMYFEIDGHSFLGYAIQKTLRLYVAEKLDHPFPRGRDPPQPDMPLLYYAVIPSIKSDYSYFDSDTQRELISMLLARGCDPNNSSGLDRKGTTTWEHFLLHIYTNKDSMTIQQSDHYLWVTEQMIRHGADQKLKVTVGTESLRPLGRWRRLHTMKLPFPSLVSMSVTEILETAFPAAGSLLNNAYGKEGTN